MQFQNARPRRGQDPRGRFGFTLIELLIVVAIIAILAAIAVPNFLEAQTRSKVSRAKSDLRTLATAEEAYYVDNNTYTTHNTAGQTPWEPNNDGGTPPNAHVWYGWGQLTTPVAFITSIPADSFGDQRVAAVTNIRPPVYEIGAGKSDTRQASSAPATVPRVPTNRDCWCASSVGPDHWDDTQGTVMGTSRFPWSGLATDATWVTQTTGANGSTGGAMLIHGTVYDPTNGTISNGDILRFGGSKPFGASYDYLYGTTAK